MNETLDTPSFSDDLIRYIGLLWHWAWLVILAIVIAGGAAFFVSRQITPVYQATATMLVNQAPSANSSEYAALLTSQRLAETYAQMLTTQPIMDGVAKSLNLNALPDSLKKIVFIEPIRETQLIKVNVQHTDPNLAASIANEVVITFSEYNENFQASRYADTEASLSSQLEDLNQRIQEINLEIQAMGDDPDLELERNKQQTTLAQNQQLFASLLQTYEEVRLAKAESTSNVVLVEPASAPIDPIRPKIIQNTLLAAAVGGILAVGLIFLLDALDNTIKSPDDVTRHLGLPVLGIIARDPTTGENDPLVTIAQPRAPVSEAYRALRTNIQFASVDKPIQSLLITSIAPSEGKTTVAANLSTTLAQGGRNVILIDADLRKPKLHQRLNLSNQKGLTSLFMQPEVLLNGTVQKTDTNNLYVMTAGNLPPNPSELLASDRMDLIISKMGKNADMVIIDTPPIMAVTDAVVLSQRVDGVLVVIRVGNTKTAAAQQTVNQLHRLNANVLGVVLNQVPTRGSRYYYSNRYYAYQEYYDKADKSKRKSLFRKRK